LRFKINVWSGGEGEFNQMLKNVDVWIKAGRYSTAMEGGSVSYPNTAEVFNVHKFANLNEVGSVSICIYVILFFP